MKGGAPMKRTRVTISELKVRENDHDMIKAIFAMNGFQVPIKISKTQKSKKQNTPNIKNSKSKPKRLRPGWKLLLLTSFGNI